MDRRIVLVVIRVAFGFRSAWLEGRIGASGYAVGDHQRVLLVVDVLVGCVCLRRSKALTGHASVCVME